MDILAESRFTFRQGHTWYGPAMLFFNLTFLVLL